MTRIVIETRKRDTQDWRIIAERDEDDPQAYVDALNRVEGWQKYRWSS